MSTEPSAHLARATRLHHGRRSCGDGACDAGMLETVTPSECA